MSEAAVISRGTLPGNPASAGSVLIIDDEAEIQRAETHQICRNFKNVHTGRGHQEGHRNHQGRNHRGADIAENQEQHCDNEQRADRQVFSHCGDRGIDQLRTVKDRFGGDAGR